MGHHERIGDVMGTGIYIYICIAPVVPNEVNVRINDTLKIYFYFHRSISNHTRMYNQKWNS